MNLEELLGIDLDYIIIGMAAVIILLLILMIVNLVQTKKIKKKYQSFMRGKNGKTLEELVLRRFDQVDDLIEANKKNEVDIRKLFENNQFVFQKVGLVKYDAFNEMGGKLSFSLALLNDKNDGFVMNAVHSRDCCYTYIKEIIAGNAIVALAEEEKEALDMAVKSKEA